MVAITVAIAAVAYAYFNGLIGGQQKEAPLFQLRADELNDRLIVVTADPAANWQRLQISSDQAGAEFLLNDEITGLNPGKVIPITGVAITTSSDPMSATEYLDIEGNCW